MLHYTSETIIKLRSIVAKYGEDQNWWPSSFFKDFSKTSIDYDFPRLNNAPLILATDLIRNVIDRKVGNHKYHLFRLGIKYEEVIHQKLLNSELDLEFDLTELESISNFISVNIKPGPKNIGSIQDLEEDGTLQIMAAEYLAAFKNNYEVHPYLN